jgi:hypothetical protein
MLGRSVLVLADPLGPRRILQELRFPDGHNLRGQAVTVGAWLRSPEGQGGAVALGLDDGVTRRWHPVESTSDWQFHAFTATVASIPGA